jgi:hypothetical protein
MAVPIIGYLIIFNDTISQHLSFNKLAGENTIDFGLSSIERLKLIYFGLIFLGSANIIYRIRRPFIIKLGRNTFEYVTNALSQFTISEYINIHGTIRHEGHQTLYGKYYDSEYETFLDMALGKKRIGNDRDESTAHWVGAKNKHEGLLRSMLIENFFRNDIKRRWSLTLCIFLSLVGYFLLLIPSADLFLKVVAVTFR